jgi:vacuolar-type H+-ATPase subunit F/Vma7
MEKEKSKTTIALDFDGVIHGYSKGWGNGLIYDKPKQGAKLAMAKLVKQGFSIVIFTTRLNPEIRDKNEAIEQAKMLDVWLGKYGFIKGRHYHYITALKPKAKVYVDDRALKFVDWENTEDLLRSILKN